MPVNGLGQSATLASLVTLVSLALALLTSMASLASWVSLTTLGLIGYNGLIGHNGLIGFIGLGYVRFIGLGLVSLIGLIGHIIGLISLINTSAMSNHRLIGLIGLILITTATARRAAHQVATMLASADKICNAMIINYLAAGLLIHQSFSQCQNEYYISSSLVPTSPAEVFFHETPA
jgi:hypothetical protein